MQTALLLLMPICLPLLIVGVAGNVAQIGLEFHAESMAPKFSKLDPLSGMKRIVSARGLVELAKSILKLAVVGLIAWSVVAGYLAEFPSLVRLDLGHIWAFTHAGAFKIVGNLSLE